MKHLLRKMLAGMLSAAMIFTGISISAPKTARAEEAVTAAVEEATAGEAVAEEATIEAESLDNAGDSVVPEFFEMTNGGWRDLYMGEGKEVGMQFTAPEDGRYAFFTSGDLDTYADMAWNKNMSPIVATNDDISGLNRNFRIDTYMSKGSTVYVKMRGYDGAVGSFRAHVCQINEVDFDWNGGEMGPDHMEKLLKYLAYLPDEFPVWGYHIFFDANGGTLPRSDEYKYFEKEFLGWNTSVDGSGTMYQPGGGFSNDSVSTLYAIWRNRPAGLLPVPTRVGYAFQGWYLSDGVQLTETTVLDGETGVSARWTPDPGSNPLIHGEENIDYLEREGELYYCFTAPSAGYYVFWSKSDTDVVGYLYSDSAMNHQLQYDDDSGNNRNFRMRQQLSSGQTVYLKVKGYQQNYGDVDVRVSKELTATYTSGTTVQTETVLYNSVVRATSWVPTKSYTVTFNANGGSTTTSTKTLDVPFRFWVDQDGWYYWTDDYYIPVVDMSFTAAWSDPEAGALPTPTRTGYTFAGWYTAASGGTKISPDSVISGNVTLYAHWTKTSQIQEMANGKNFTGTIEPGQYTLYRFKAPNTMTFVFMSKGSTDTYGRLYTDEAMKNQVAQNNDGGADKNFKITYRMNAGDIVYLKVSGGSSTAAGDYTVLVGKKSTISYNANGGTGAPAPQEKIQGQGLKLSTEVPTRSGYTFLGWATDQTATTSTYQPGDVYPLNDTITLYAVWKKNAAPVQDMANGKNFTGTVEPGGYTVYRFKAPNTMTFVFMSKGSTDTYGRLYTDEALKNQVAQNNDGGADKNFKITYRMNAGDIVYLKVSGGSSTAAGDYTVLVGKKSTISYNANGGTGAPAPQEKIQGLGLRLSTEVPTRSGYTFQGWATSKTATTATYQPGDVYPLNDTITLYAVWKK